MTDVNLKQMVAYFSKATCKTLAISIGGIDTRKVMKRYCVLSQHTDSVH
jgi:hypothetical protein